MMMFDMVGLDVVMVSVRLCVFLICWMIKCVQIVEVVVMQSRFWMKKMVMQVESFLFIRLQVRQVSGRVVMLISVVKCILSMLVRCLMIGKVKDVNSVMLLILVKLVGDQWLFVISEGVSVVVMGLVIDMFVVRLSVVVSRGCQVVCNLVRQVMGFFWN